jgi:hypothetical protein
MSDHGCGVFRVAFGSDCSHQFLIFGLGTYASSLGTLPNLRDEQLPMALKYLTTNSSSVYFLCVCNSEYLPFPSFQ